MNYLVGSLLTINYLWLSYDKLILADYAGLWSLCSLTLLVASLGFLLKDKRLIVLGVVGQWYMMVLWFIVCVVYFSTNIVLSKPIGVIVDSPIYLQANSWYHLYLPLLGLFFLKPKDVPKETWKYLSYFMLAVLLFSFLFGRAANANYIFEMDGVPHFWLIEIICLPLFYYLGQKNVSFILRKIHGEK